MVEREKQALEENNGRKLLDLQAEKDDLTGAIDFERAEQDRLRRLTHKKEFEQELMSLRAGQEIRRR
jgi:hypothetical protein